VEASSRQ